MPASIVATTLILEKSDLAPASANSSARPPLTGYGLAVDKARAAEAGVYSHVIKPTKVDLLERIFDQLVSHGAAACHDIGRNG